MSEWIFRLIIAGVELIDTDLDTLFEAGCDDATFARERDGSVLGLFDREADTPEAAVLSALVDVESAGIDARVVRLAVEDDWLTAAEVADRVGAGSPRGSAGRKTFLRKQGWFDRLRPVRRPGRAGRLGSRVCHGMPALEPPEAPGQRVAEPKLTASIF